MPMNKHSTIHSLFTTLNDQNTDELSDFIKLIEDNPDDYKEVFDYISTLECDVSDEKVAEIIQFAKDSRRKFIRKEKAAFS